MELEKILDRKTVEIIDFLLDNPVMDYSKKDISEMTDISRSTVHRKWPVLDQLDIITKTRKYQNTQLYSLNQNSEIVNTIGELIDHVEEKSAEKEETVAA